MTDGIPKIGPIEIKKGEGITYALKRIAEENKAIFSDGKITAKEWDKTLDALIDIQNERKANNKQSIFGGGTDKSRAGWRNSFVVHKGQTIEFTDEELTKIFNAMGASFTKPPAGDNPPPTAPPAAPPAGVTQEERNDEDGNTYTADIQNGQEIKRTYKRGDGTLDEVREYQDGKEVKYTSYASDDTTVDFTRETEYAGDKVSKETYKRGDGTLSRVREYQDGKEVKYTDYAADGTTVDFTEETEYAGDEVSKETWKRGDGTLDVVREYQDGKEVKRTNYASDGTTIDRYTENGKLSMVRLKSKTKNESIVHHTFEFDENGVCKESTLADALKKKIGGPSLNYQTKDLLKQLTPENVIKVMTSYEAIAGKSLLDAIDDEWGFDIAEMKKLVNDALAQRKKDLGAPDDISFEDLVKLDTEKT